MNIKDRNPEKKEWTIEIRPKKRLLDIDLKGLWLYRDLFYMYVKRDIITVYKQTILGPLWFLIQPILTTIMYMFVFGGLAGISTDGVPQSLFYMSGILLWNYFNTVFMLSSNIFIANANIFGKVYFPRLVVPLSGIASNLVGERKLHAAYLLGKYVMRISILVSLVLSCIWALMGHTLFSWLTDNPEIIRLGTIILFIDVILEVGRAINIYATNALRATGDVNYPFYVGFVVQWSVAVGCGFLFGIHWGWGLVGMWCAFVLDENLRGIIFVQRWNSLKWTKKGFVK